MGQRDLWLRSGSSAGGGSPVLREDRRGSRRRTSRGLSTTRRRISHERIRRRTPPPLAAHPGRRRGRRHRPRRSTSATRRSTSASPRCTSRSPTTGRKRQGGLGGSAPNVARWLGDIRSFFPTSVVRVMQQDAMERLGLQAAAAGAGDAADGGAGRAPRRRPAGDVAASCRPRRRRRPGWSCARSVEEIERKLAEPMRQAVNGALNRSVRNRRPRHREIDWNRTIRANLKNYQPEYKTVVPETRIGFGRKRNALRDIILCIDQSGSMATSVVYAGIFGAVLASLPAVRTQVVVFDTAVVDLSDKLDDPVEVLFGTQLGGGTDINQALDLLPGPDPPAGADDLRAHQRPDRRRRAGEPAEAGGVDRRLRRAPRDAAGAERRRRARSTTTTTPPPSRRSARPRSRARPTCSPT